MRTSEIPANAKAYRCLSIDSPRIAHSILGTLLDRLNLTPILNVAGVCAYGHIRNAEEVFLEYMGYFETVKMLQPSLSQ